MWPGTHLCSLQFLILGHSFNLLQMSESPDANDNPPAEVPQKTSNGREEVQNNEDVKKEDKKDEATASVQPPGMFIEVSILPSKWRFLL